MDTLPGDVLLVIANYLRLPDEVLHLGLVSNHVFRHLLPALYSNVILSGSRQCIQTLGMLSRRAECAQHVRTLCVKPDDLGQVNARPMWGRDALQNGYIISAAVRRAASKMEILQKFVWDGEELPPNDDMWFALRMLCPNLKYIGTSLGSILTSPNSHLFDFSDLTGFSLTFKAGFFANFDGARRDEAIPGYQRLWEMLIRRCPGLEELIVDGISSTGPVDAHRLTRGRWPYLRKLILGDVVTEWHSALNHVAKRNFLTFLELHRGLETLHLRGRQSSVSAPSILENLHPFALGNVKEFGGSIEQLQVFQQRSSINILHVTDPIVLRESTPLTVSGILSTVSRLNSLTISFSHANGYDNGSVIRSIASACPLLEHLNLVCDGQPAFSFSSFCNGIRSLTRLRSLCLGFVRSRGEDSLVACGSRLVLSNPRLATFTLSFLAQTVNPRSRGDVPVVLQTAKFELTSDYHGLPLSLRVVEHRGSMLWWRPSSVRVSTVDMRPPGYPGTQRGGLLSLLIDPNPAGQEIRLICICITLLVSSIGGCLIL